MTDRELADTVREALLNARHTYTSLAANNDFYEIDVSEQDQADHALATLESRLAERTEALRLAKEQTYCQICGTTLAASGKEQA